MSVEEFTIPTYEELSAWEAEAQATDDAERLRTLVFAATSRARQAMECVHTVTAYWQHARKQVAEMEARHPTMPP